MVDWREPEDLIAFSCFDQASLMICARTKEREDLLTEAVDQLSTLSGLLVAIMLSRCNLAVFKKVRFDDDG